MVAMAKIALASLCVAAPVQGVHMQAKTSTALSMQMQRANPIRRVVTMLQKIQKKVETEGEEQTELHEKFMCQCKTGTATYTQDISDGEAKVESLAASLESSKGQLSQLKSDLAQHKADRTAAKEALAEATAMREKEAAAFAGVKAEAEANIAAMTKAVAAIEKGTGGSFLQTDAAKKLSDVISSNQAMSDDARNTVLAFLSNSEESAGSGEITGILKQLGDEMKKDLADATSTEETAIANFNELTAAKQAEVATLTTAIEDKITRVGETGLEIEDTKADAKDTADKLAEDNVALADLKKECAQKEKDWDAISKERQAELLAIADTIKMLNDDDALELFKKTLPSAASSFMQVSVRASVLKAGALAVLRKHHHARIDLISMALHGKTQDFSKVVKMIDEMVGVLGTEQKDDDEKKEYCNTEIDGAEDKMKVNQQEIKDTETAIADAKETIATLEKEITALVGGLAILDNSVTQATAQRKKENAAWKTLQASNTAAKDLIMMAKKRLNKFYNPKLALVATAFLQVRATDKSAFQKSGEAATGVIAMMDSLAADLDKETAIAETDEKDAQADYETFMADSKKMRADNSKIVEDKGAAKADAIGALQNHEDMLQEGFTKLKGVSDELSVLHKDCDWLLSNFDARKEARADEVDALKKAKAVLSGASLIEEQ